MAAILGFLREEVLSRVIRAVDKHKEVDDRIKEEVARTKVDRSTVRSVADHVVKEAHFG